MRLVRALGVSAVAVVLLAAHVGSPDVLFDGMAGPYGVRVLVRPPDVVPGLAEVTVRVGADDARRVSIRPVFWRTGVTGAPSADELRPVPGERRLYTGQLWLMSYGGASVYVTVDGARGSGTVIVPVNSFAVRTLSVPAGLGALLVVLGILLAVGLLTLIWAGAGESLAPPGAPLDPVLRHRANRVLAFAAPALALAIFAGARWWGGEDARARRQTFRPPAATPVISVDSAHRTLRLTVRDTASFRTLLAPAMPDHGKMMHLFLMSKTGLQTFAHLHPVQSDSLVFTTELPWITAGPYLLFGDLTLENGVSLTVANTLDVPAAPGRVAPSDSDDTWDRTTAVTLIQPGAVRALSPEYVLAWTGDAPPLAAGQPTDLRFELRDSTGAPRTLGSYLGMPAHAVIVRSDGSVFIHLHPMGTFAPAAQRAFALRDRGDTLPGGRLLPDSSPADARGMPGMAAGSSVSFPYEFPKPGRYRIWVQVRPAGAARVQTGTFDVDVR